MREQILLPDKDLLYHGTYKNIQVLGLNNDINVSYVTPNRNYAARYGPVITMTPTRPLRILVLSKKALEAMLPLVPNTRIGNKMIKAMMTKHHKAKNGVAAIVSENYAYRLVDKGVRNIMETATYRNLMTSKPIKITNNGYIRNSDEMLDLAIYSMITRIAKKMGYDGIRTVTRGTVKNSNNIRTLSSSEIVFPGRAPLRVIERNMNKPSPPPPDPRIEYRKIIKRAGGPERWFTKIQYDRFGKKRVLAAFGLPANANLLSFARKLIQ